MAKDREKEKRAEEFPGAKHFVDGEEAKSAPIDARVVKPREGSRKIRTWDQHIMGRKG
jgi:hypothetical protein